ncbi:MAG: hypothetical protein V9F06_03260 [Thermomicrobiales bacterium]
MRTYAAFFPSTQWAAVSTHPTPVTGSVRTMVPVQTPASSITATTARCVASSCPPMIRPRAEPKVAADSEPQAATVVTRPKTAESKTVT